MSRETPKGHNCETCGVFHDWPGYVYAHTREVITHTCDVCGAKTKIVMCHARQSKKGKTTKAVMEAAKLRMAENGVTPRGT